MDLRKDTDIWLIGHTSELKPTQLPTGRDVLKYFFHLRNLTPPPVSTKEEIAKEAIFIIRKLWTNAGIQTMTRTNSETKLLKLFEDWNSLKKNKNRNSDKENGKRSSFCKQIDILFDIASPDAESIIRNDRLRSNVNKEDDIAFLADQRGPRMMAMGTEDKGFSKKVKRKIERQEISESRTAKWESEMKCDGKMDYKEENVVSQESEEEFNGDEQSDPTFESPGSEKKPRNDFVTLQLPRNLSSSKQVTQNADRLGLSQVQLFSTLASVIESSSADVNDFVLSPTSVRSARNENRKNISEDIKRSFVPHDNCVIHWDGKIVKEITGEKEDRIGVILTGHPEYKSGKLLAIPAVDSSSGVNQANAVLSCIQDWNISRNIVGLCFDTTSSNSGKYTGACVVLERLLKKKVMYLACRHHVMELILKEAVVCIFGKTTAPTNPEFGKFQEKWESVNVESFQTLQAQTPWMEHRKTKVIEILNGMLQKDDGKNTFLREDYREVAEITLVALGETPPRGIRFRKPGAFHHARWMSSILYFTKMYLFAQQMKYSSQYIEKLRRIVTFISLIYVSYWLKSPLALEAYKNDLQLHGDLQRFSRIDKQLGEAALKVQERHLWYLTPELASFAFFSDNVSEAEKEDAASKMMSFPPNMKLGKPQFPTFQITLESNLVDFISGRSWLIFNYFNSEENKWLEQPASKWNEYANFRKMKESIENISVVNDPAERSVKLIEDFACKVTKDEKQRQYLLQCVEDHRKNKPSLRKKSAFSKF